MEKKNYIIYSISIFISLLLILLFFSIINDTFLNGKKYKHINQPIITSNDDIGPTFTNITLSFIGDCTLGTDDKFGYSKSFTEVFNKNNKDYSYFFKGVVDILNKDDLTIANLETTFTTANKKLEKEFNFKGDPSYVNILKQGSIEITNLANNHTYDYLEQGYNDTINTLKNNSINYYGRDVLLIKEVKGIKIGFIGLSYSDNIDRKKEIKKAMEYFNKQNVALKIVSMHWGMEKEYQFNTIQQDLGKYAVDQGADLVIGHHPHVLEGIEEYKGSHIVYSLGNFVFGGNYNPGDKDSMIYQHTFTFVNGLLVNNKHKIIPVSISSKTYVNDYQPTILNGSDKTRVINKINKYSKNYKYVEI